MKPIHLWSTVLAAAFLCLVPALSGWAGSSKKPDSFPKYFRPLSWDIDAKKVKSLFPKSTVVTSKVPTMINGHREEMTMVSVQGTKWNYLGKAPTEIFFDHDGKVHHIAIQAMVTKRLKHSYYLKLLKAYGQLKKYFTSQYGKPTEDSISSDDTQKYQPKSSTWSTKNFSLLLFVMGDEKDYWALNVLVQRS